MERYQQAMVNIMTRAASPQMARHGCSASSLVPPITALPCPAGTPQDTGYLTIPFAAPSERPTATKEPRKPKEQEASMFIAGSDSQLIIGTPEEYIVIVISC